MSVSTLPLAIRILPSVVSLDPPNHAVLFSANTEVSIAPKGRTTSVRGTQATSTQPDEKKLKSSLGQLESVESLVLRVLPFNLALGIEPSDTYPTAWVSQRTLSALTTVVSTAPIDRISFTVTIRRLQPPLPVNGATPSQSSTPAQPRILHSATDVVKPVKENASVPNQIQARLAISDNLPERHLVGRGLPGCSNWDLVEYYLYHAFLQFSDDT